MSNTDLIFMYIWIGHGLKSGTTLAFSMWLSNVKTKTSFGFLIIRNYEFIELFNKLIDRTSYRLYFSISIDLDQRKF